MDITTLTEAFERQVAANPDAPALKFLGQQLTYGELNNRANQLAAYLRECGVVLETRVGLCLDRGFDTVVAILAVLKAGGAYVPMDPLYPTERVRMIVEDAECPIVLIHTRYAERFFATNGTLAVVLDAEVRPWEECPESNVTAITEPSSLAYVIYTSGSTGTPKGALITHQNVVRLFTSTDNWFNFGPGDVWTLFHSYAFDFSVWEMWGAYFYGGSLIIVPYLVSRSPEQFYQLLLDEKVTVLNQTPSAFKQLQLYDETIPLALAREISLRYVIFGGETLDFPGLATWFDRHGDTQPELVNMYGITETTVFVTYRPVRIADTFPKTPSFIGVPIPDLTLYILDENRRPVATGEVGELYVGGGGVGLGYLNRPDLTAERFVPDPLASGDTKCIFYKSGDLVRLWDGDLEFLGRNDMQVQLRGFRVELGEIESALNRHVEIRGSVVQMREDIPGDQRLVAYYLAQKPLAVEELREHLGETLPTYMIPGAFLRLEAFPLNNNGKIDSGALPAPAYSAAAGDYVTPSTDCERKLATIWKEVLGVPQVGTRDDFFQLGGHSLLITQCLVRIKQRFGLEFPIRFMLREPTIESQAKEIVRLQEEGATPEELEDIPSSDRAGNTPLSCSQERLWVIEQIHPDITAYQIPIFFEITGDLDPDRFKRAFQKVVQRHDVLRTVILSNGSSPIQRVLEDVEVPIDVQALDESLDELETGAAARLAVSAATRTPMNLASGPLLKVKLYRVGAEQWFAGLIVHHVIFDGWSIRVLLDELSAIYTALAEGREHTLTRLPLQYVDFAAWQREQINSQRVLKQLEFWKHELAAPLPILNLLGDFPRPPIQTFAGSVAQARIDSLQTEKLEQLALQHRKTIFVVLLAGWGMLLSRYSGQDDIVIGSAIAGRNHAELEPLIGFFVNTVALRMRLEQDMPFSSFLDRVEDVVLAAQDNQEVPFERVVAEVQRERDPSRSPIFQVMFVLHNTPEYKASFSGLRITGEELSNDCAKFDLTLAVQPGHRGLSLNLEYNTAIFKPATAERILSNFQTLLDSIVESPGTPLSHFQVLTPLEQQEILVEWNNTSSEYPSCTCVHHIFEEQAESKPHATALIFQGSSVSYQELNRRANQLAHYLQAKGVGPEWLVATYLERSVTQIVAILAILKAGGAYVPLDLVAPKERLKRVLEDTDAKFVLTTSCLEQSLPYDQVELVKVDQVAAEIDKLPARNLDDVQVHHRHLAYVMYTSGSSGMPKGVCIDHRSIVRLVKTTNYADFGQDHTFLQFAPVSFDASTFEIWGALLNGAKLVIYPPEFASLGEFSELVQRESVTTLWLTAGLFHKIVERHPEALSGLRQLLAGGDVLSPEHVKKVLDTYPKCRLINGYGPTECTTFACCHTIRAQDLAGYSVPIGAPISNTTAYVLDSRGMPVPLGVAGELYIGGDGVARGYLNRRRETAERFLPDPFSANADARLYRTGDFVRWLPGGILEFIGRADYQVKLRGYRIELPEIEAVLRCAPQVADALVLATEDGVDEKRLVAYVIGQNQGGIDLAGIRHHLREHLPQYMHPSSFVVLQEFPLNTNGKVDLKALARHEWQPATIESADEIYSQQELKLKTLWQRVLGIESVGRYDNFFDRGGNSLLSLEMIDAVRESFGVNLSLRRFLEHPTIAQLSDLVDENAAPEGVQYESSHREGKTIAVPLRSSGPNRPFFFICGAADVAEAYGRLAAHMSPDQPFFGLQESADALETSRDDSIEELAEHFIDTMREIQRHGPYCLGGWSFGGVVAFQMARRLWELGEQVQCLIVVDCEAGPTSQPWRQRTLRSNLYSMARAAFRLLRNVKKRVMVFRYGVPLLPGYGKDIFQIVWKKFSGTGGHGREDLLVSEYVQWARGDMADNYEFMMAVRRGNTSHRSRITYMQDPYVRSLHRVMTRRRLAMRAYRTREYEGSIVLVRSEESPIEWRFCDKALGWDKAALGGLSIHTIPGDHMSIIREPDVRGLAEVIQAQLDEASETEGS